MSKYKKTGWYNESERHSLSAQGIPNASAISNIPIPVKSPPTTFESESTPVEELSRSDDTLTQTNDSMIEVHDTEAGRRNAKMIIEGAGEGLKKGGAFLKDSFIEGLHSVFGENEAEVQRQIMQDVDSIVLDEEGDPIKSLDGSTKTKKQVEVERHLAEVEKAQLGGLFTSDYRTEGETKRESTVDKIKDFLNFGELEPAREQIYILKAQEKSYQDKLGILDSIRQEVLSKSNRNAIPISDQFRQINFINNAIGELESDRRIVQDELANLQPKFNKKAVDKKLGIDDGKKSFLGKIFDPSVPAEDLFN